MHISGVLGSILGRVAFATGVVALWGCAGVVDEPGGSSEGFSAATTEDIARRVHGQSIVLDAHADIVLPTTSTAYLDTDKLSKATPEKLSAGSMGAVVMSVAVGPGPRTPDGDAEARAEADEKLATVLALVNSTDSLGLATSVAEVKTLRGQNRTAVILGYQNARSLERDVTALNEFYNSGVRVFGLNHMGHNDFSDSSRPIFDGATGTYEVEQEHGGLSALGIAAIKRINNLGGIIDVSQMSKAATLQAIALSTSPVIASHSNAKTLSAVTRNLSDEELDRIGATGGVVHLAAFGAYLVDLSDPALLAAIKNVRLAAGLPEQYSYPYELYWELDTEAEKRAFVGAMRDVIGTGSVDRLIDHIDYVVNRIGIDHVGIGTDFNHGGGISGFTNASEALNVTKGLIARGYSAEAIQKIWGGNFLRVMASAQAR